MVAADLLPSLEGVELGAIGKVPVRVPPPALLFLPGNSLTPSIPSQTVSYAQFLYPTNALVRQKSSNAADCAAPQPRFRGNGQKNIIPGRVNSSAAQDSCKAP